MNCLDYIDTFISDSLIGKAAVKEFLSLIRIPKIKMLCTLSSLKARLRLLCNKLSTTQQRNVSHQYKDLQFYFYPKSYH